MLTAWWPLFTRPMYSSIRFGFVPAAWMIDGASMRRGMVGPSYKRNSPRDYDRLDGEPRFTRSPRRREGPAESEPSDERQLQAPVVRIDADRCAEDVQLETFFDSTQYTEQAEQTHLDACSAR